MSDKDFRPPKHRDNVDLPKFIVGNGGLPPAPTIAPREAAVVAEKAAAMVDQADALEHRIKMVSDGVKKRAQELMQRAEEIETDALNYLTTLSERRAAINNEIDKFLEQTGRWQAGLREVFAKSADAQS